MNCAHCQSSQSQQYKKTTSLGYVVFRCHGCGRTFNERTGTAFNYLQFPTDVVLLVVLWRIRYKLSLRDLTEMFLVRGYEFTHEARTVRKPRLWVRQRGSNHESDHPARYAIVPHLRKSQMAG